MTSGKRLKGKPGPRSTFSCLFAFPQLGGKLYTMEMKLLTSQIRAVHAVLNAF